MASREGGPDFSNLAHEEFRCNAVLQGHTSAVLCCSFDSFSATLASGSEDGELKLWRFVQDSWACVKTLECGASVMTCQFQPPGNADLLCTGSADNMVRIWKALKGDCVAQLAGHTDSVSCCDYDPMDAQRVCTGSHDGNLILWRINKEKIVRQYKGHKGAVHCVRFNPNGELLASGSQDKKIMLWSVTQGHLVAKMEGHDGMVNCLAFHPSTEWMVSGGTDKDMRLWRESDGHFVREIKGHKGSVNAVCFGPGSGELMVSVESNGQKGRTNTAWIWQFRAGTRKSGIKEVLNTHVLRGHEGGITACSISPNAALLCTASRDASLRLWKLWDAPQPGGGLEGAAAAAAGGDEGAGAAKKKAPQRSRAELRREMGHATGNPVKDFVKDVQESMWEWAYELQGGSEQSGVQSHEVRGRRRVNAGHQNVYGWVDEKPDPHDGASGGKQDNCLQQ